MAMNHGCDLNCGNQFFTWKMRLKGTLEEKTLDEAVIRLFTTRMKLGLFDGDEAGEFNAIDYKVVDSQSMRALNIKAAEKSIVLLKKYQENLAIRFE